MKALQHGEIICPLGSQLSFELFVSKGVFLYQELYGSISHRQCADHKFFKGNGLFLCFVGHLLSRGWISGKRNTLAMAIPVSPLPSPYVGLHGDDLIFNLIVGGLRNDLP